MSPKFFKTIEDKKIPLPVFFPDATRAVLKTLDSVDITNTQTPGVLVNTFHLYLELGKRVLIKHGGVGNFMNWAGGIISDSGGFQVMSVIKANPAQGKVIDEGVIYRPSKNKKILFTPEESIKFQSHIKPDMLVVLDDFTPPQASREQAEDTVNRTIAWASRCKDEFQKIYAKTPKAKRPYLLAVVQGGDYLDLRKYCAQELVKIGFDGFGYGGWPMRANGEFNYQVAQTIADCTPKDYLLYGLGIGKPDEIVKLVKMGYHIFDCVLPTRDARHQRLYVYTAKSIDQINLNDPKFYKYLVPTKQKYYSDTSPVSTACDCLLCTNYSKSYLSHLFKIGDSTAMRLATIHILRFYSLLMEKQKTRLT
ncbi:queuine tRNA-ribosyltransferase family protein [Patescibacteria group bacterium]|nr:queuine tRNA-ribosyltransferase family protein [Patescibacteria group bacterium]MBU1457398.1 queuine tRNA-ribosyltransferase family protein [Patescibacteria group bacterium]